MSVARANWLEEHAAGLQHMADLQPEEDLADSNALAILVLRRIAHDIDSLARARRIEYLSSKTIDADACLHRRLLLCEPPITAPEVQHNVYQARRAWEWPARNIR